MKKYILAYDFGTSGVKAAMVGFDGTLYGYETAAYPLISEQQGYAEQNPTDYWSAICSSTNAVIQKLNVPKDSVLGMSFGTQGMGIIPVDEAGEVLHNNITWIDSRARKQADEINEKLGDHVVDASDTLSKLLWYKQNEPELYAKTKYILDCTGFLVLKATGKCVADYTGSAPYSPIPAIDDYLKNLYVTAGLDLEKFPPLIPCTGYVGDLTKKAAEELGVTEDVRVYMGVVDVTVAAIGAACCKKGDVHVYLGTSGWISAITGSEYLTDVSTGIYQLPSVDVNALIYGGCVQSSCLALDWTIDRFYHKEKEDLGEGVYPLIEEETREVPPGSNGVFASPWLMGERCPIMDEKARGVFIGLSNLTSRGDMVNAMMESIAFSLRMQMDYYQHDTGMWPEKIGAIGGGALRDHWMQMMADIMNTPIYRPKNCRHAGALGAAAIVAVGSGMYKVDEVDQFIQQDCTFEPIPENAKRYAQIYEQWKEIYPSLKELFAKMN